MSVDTHAHLHEAFDLGGALDAAHAAAERAGAGTCVLCLARTPGERAWERLSRAERPGGWRFEADPAEPGVLASVAGPGRLPLLLVDGRQLVTAERVEVLALCPDPSAAASLRPGRPLGETLAAVAAADAVPVLPHGVGKWLGARGRLVARAIDLALPPGEATAEGERSSPRLCVADNAGRFTLGPRPPVLDQAAALGLTVLTGSDPLPLRSAGSRLGGLGVLLERDLPRGGVAATLRTALPLLGPTPRTFGGHAGFLRVLFEQVALRVLRRRQRPTRVATPGVPA